MADVLQEIKERHEYTRNALQDIRKEAALDMRAVAGNPWDPNDEQQRKNRPTIAPEEMGQYFNQVINQLWANPRGMKFAPVGNGASAKGAQFYQNKARETEYRSHAKIAYTTAAADAIQRSYGYVRIVAKYPRPGTSNQELYIEACPDPDMVSLDPDAKRPDSSDMKFGFVENWIEQSEFKREHKKAKVVNFSDWATSHPNWVAGNKVCVAEYWTISTRPRQLVLVQQPAPQSTNPLMPPMPGQQIEVFDDEVPAGAQIVQDLRKVDFPQVRMYLTNGLEILHEQDWLGKYIPIVSCYGKVLYVPDGGVTKKRILSMTRFMRVPWKAYCYACSQELEVLAMVPKAPFVVPKGTFPGNLARAVEESMYSPKAFIEYEPRPNGWQGDPAGPPMHADYPAGQHLQALEVVKEGFRRAIQSAAGSNFLPSNAQRHNDKSGVALETIEKAAATGTFHFINNYEDMIRQVGVIFEDLVPHYYDFAGETGVILPDGQAETIQINQQGEEAISTKGDYLVTVSTAPSTDSEHTAVEEFSAELVKNIAVIAQIAGPKAASALLAKSIKLRNGGPQMDQLADIIEPPEYKSQDGETPNPEVLALKGENDQLKQVLQQAAMEKQAKVVEIDGKFQIESMKQAHEDERAALDRETKLAVAALTAQVTKLSLFLEERARVGAQVHDDLIATEDRVHQRAMAERQHQQALESGAQGIDGQMAVNEQSAALQPQEPAA